MARFVDNDDAHDGKDEDKNIGKAKAAPAETGYGFAMAMCFQRRPFPILPRGSAADGARRPPMHLVCNTAA